MTRNIDDITFEEYEISVAQLQEAIGDTQHWDKHGERLTREMKDRNLAWCVVCGGNIVAGTGNLDEFPDNEAIEKIGRKHNRIPFAYGADTPIEETSPSLVRMALERQLTRV